MTDTYWCYSRSDRLRRLGTDLLDSVRDSCHDSHGHWELVPWSLGLVDVSLPPRAGTDAKGDDLKVYQEFKKSHPTGLIADWMYGGDTLLLYRDGGQDVSDGETAIDGLECRAWSKDKEATSFAGIEPGWPMR